MVQVLHDVMRYGTPATLPYLVARADSQSYHPVSLTLKPPLPLACSSNFPPSPFHPLRLCDPAHPYLPLLTKLEVQ
eukprot:749065-Hanusia_phi.AAC.1